MNQANGTDSQHAPSRAVWGRRASPAPAPAPGCVCAPLASRKRGGRRRGRWEIRRPRGSGIPEALEARPAGAAAPRKRKIAILKAQGKSAEAIRELNEYLEQFVGDQEAWHELSELYINEHDYAKAAFCLEELMMTNPHNHLYCEQYAEVKYTQGGMENLELSRKYFAQALKLNNRNMRALFGLYMSASHIAASPKVSAKVKKDNVKYAAWAAAQINRAYQLAGRGTKDSKCSVKAVEEMLESMQITMS
ncbi:hypothetical protein ANANG_G00013420 [Anguilla anguilla]|uniref:ER membrane protein complex subunit 2 n=1 Tax=Anguilla anguilla TaxID=7936 RepID=A0A9D3N1A1_ANGAN|nr:hypothetical protein ANANG_G00013420 [Anguilla anguilla]